MTFGILIVFASAVLLLSCGASLLALYWNVKSGPQRGRAAFILSCVGLLFGYLGLSYIRLSASKTINGHLEWSVNSRWFFLAALFLAVASLVLSAWNWRKASSSRTAAPLPEST
jgi:hypothetical protein